MSAPSAKALQRKVERAPRILIVRVGAMGDVIHALPAVAGLREALPEAHIGWAVEPRWAPLLRAAGATARDPQRMPLVDAVHMVEAKTWNRRPFSPGTMRSILRLWRELRRVEYDIAVDLQGTLRSAVIARLSGAPVVIGSASPREGVATALYRKKVPLHSIHVTDQAGELLEEALRVAAAGKGSTQGVKAPYRLPVGSPLPLLPRDAAAEGWWQERRANLYGDRPTVLLAATAGWGAKEWPPAKFAELSIRLAARGYCVLFNAPPGEVDPVTLETVLLARDRDRTLSWNVMTLPATLPQLVAATREVHAVIAGDTGPLHLAAALLTPAVGLFGPTAPERTGPRGRAVNRAVNLRHGSSVTDHRRHARAEAGLPRITVDEVVAAFEQVVEADGEDA